MYLSQCVFGVSGMWMLQQGCILAGNVSSRACIQTLRLLNSFVFLVYRANIELNIFCKGAALQQLGTETLLHVGLSLHSLYGRLDWVTSSSFSCWSAGFNECAQNSGDNPLAESSLCLLLEPKTCKSSDLDFSSCLMG